MNRVYPGIARQLSAEPFTLADLEEGKLLPQGLIDWVKDECEQDEALKALEPIQWAPHALEIVKKRLAEGPWEEI